MNANDSVSPKDARTPADTGTLGKAMAILDLVAQTSAPMRFSDILAAAGEPEERYIGG